MNAIKKMMLAHGEKLGMLLVAALAGFIVYSSLGQESLPANRKADQLKSVADRTSQVLTTYTWDQAKEQATDVIKLHEPAANAGSTIKEDDYLTSKAGWDPARVPETVQRTDPTLLTATDLEVGAVTGLMAFYSAARIRVLQLEEAKKAAEQARAQAESRDAAAEAERTGRNREEGTLGEYGPGGEELDPNKRPVTASIRPAGVATDGSELIVKTSCACITAKVPIEKQYRKYLEALENARGFNEASDYPRYAGYIVERAEAVRDGELKWQGVRVRNGQDSQPLTAVSQISLRKAIVDWPQMMEDLSDPQYAHPILTFPLPPLVGRDWGDLARHSEVPLAAETAAALAEAEEKAATATEEGTNGDDMFGATPGANPYGGGEEGFGPRGGGRGFAPGGRGGEMGRSARFGGERDFGGEYGGEGGGGGLRGYAAGGSIDDGSQFRATTPFVMLRFFDFSVEPGKRYKYRVKLVMYDVNFGLPAGYLAKEVNERLKPLIEAKKPSSVLMSEWSDPSPTVSVPLAGAGLLAAVKPSTDPVVSEPTATLLVQGFDVEDQKAIQAAKEKDFRRGSLLAMKEEVEVLTDQNRYIEKKESFDFDTGITLLDMAGGESLSRDMNVPGRALLMDAGGRLYVESELEDELDVAMHRATFAEDPNATPGRGGFEGGRGGEGGFFGSEF